MGKVKYPKRMLEAIVLVIVMFKEVIELILIIISKLS